jgi:hypothetical protein
VVSKIQGNARGSSLGSPTTATLNSTPKNGNVLIAVIGLVGSSGVSSISQNGVTWSRQAQKIASSGVISEIWLGTVSSGAYTTLTVYSDCGSNYRQEVDVCEYSGIASNPLDKPPATNAGLSTSGDTGTTATTTQANELWIGGITGCSTYAPTQSSPTNGFTLLDGSAESYTYAYQSVGYLEKIVYSTGQANSGVSFPANTNWAGCIATFKAAVMEATSDCNCTTYTPGMENYCNKGVTLWGTGASINTYLAPYGGTGSVSFTGTHPKGYISQNACNVTWDILTSSSSGSNDVHIGCGLNGNSISERIHSKVQGHDITETIDLSPIPWYDDDGYNWITFTNNTDVGVWINNLRIIRVYGMCNLGDASCYNQHPEQATGSDGSLDWTREDYPCLYERAGVRYSFTKFGGPGSSQGQYIDSGQSKSWTFVNPPSTTLSNYVSSYSCLFNFNNVQMEGDSSGYDAQYTVSLNTHNIATYYQSRIRKLTQAASVDLAKSPYYNDAPNAINTVTLTNNSAVRLMLLDGIEEGEPGRIDIYRVYRTANNSQDNFNDNSTDYAIWNNKLQANGATATETGSQLQVTVQSGSGWAQAGYVTKYAYNMQSEYGYNLQGLEAIIDVTELDSLDQMSLLICNTPVTSSDPYNENNWYRIVKGRRCYGTNVLAVENRLYGTWAMKLNTPWISPTGQLKISVSTGSIAFYENGVLRYAEPFALPSQNCYVYVYTSSERSVSTGTDKFDNYALYPTEMFRDDFKDGNYNGWTVDSGAWQVASGQLRSTAQNSHIHVNAPFTANRHVKTDIQTLTHSGDPWHVPWLFVKEQDGYNNVYALIHTNGTVELAMFYQGQKTMWTASSSLNPYNPHVLAVSIIGTNAKVWVDGTLYIDVTHTNLANLAGYVGLYTPSSTGSFDNIVVFDE